VLEFLTNRNRFKDFVLTVKHNQSNTMTAKNTKTTVAPTAAAPAPEVAKAKTAAVKAESVAPPAPAAEAPKKTVAKKAVAAKPAAESTPATTPVAPIAESTPADVPAASDSTQEDVFAGRFASLLEKLASLGNSIREVTTEVRSLQKDHARFVRENSKRAAKRQRTTGKRTASGFAKPTLLSAEMYEFLDMEKDSMVVRNDVTRKLNEYVVKNELRDASDKRKILPDAKLRTLLNVPEGDTLTYFNIQKYIKHHFVKPVATA
jgi:hypothetical protein